MTMGARGALAGAIAGVVAVALMLKGALTAGFPVIALALWERTLRLLPMEVFGFLIVRLKFLAKPLAFWGMLGGVIVIWSLLGYLVGRAPWLRRPSAARGAAGGVLLRVLATFLLAFAVTFIPLVGLAFTSGVEYLRGRLEGMEILDLSRAAVAAQVVGAIAAYSLVFAVAVTLFTAWPARRRGGLVGTPDGSGARGPASSREGEASSRREVLRRSLTLLFGLVTGSVLGRWIATMGQEAVAFAQDIFARVKGLPPEVTPNDKFYVVSKNPPGLDPVLDADQWSLEVFVHAERRVFFSYAQIRALPSVRRPHTLECISNEVGGDLISNAVWRGVRLRDVLERAGGVNPKAIKIVFRCADGYTESLPVADALHPDTLLVYEMNGEPLPPKHGHPLRALVPGLFGMKNPKWITKIHAVDYDFQGFWEKSGWSDEAVVKTMSKFTAPPLRAPRPKLGEEVGVGGVAYSGDRSIQAVEVSFDDGKTWRPAQTRPAQGKYTWVLWASLWKPEGPGEYRLKVRARDGTGVVQTERPSPTLPDGATGYHMIRVRVER